MTKKRISALYFFFGLSILCHRGEGARDIRNYLTEPAEMRMQFNSACVAHSRDGSFFFASRWASPPVDSNQSTESFPVVDQWNTKTGKWVRSREFRNQSIATLLPGGYVVVDSTLQDYNGNILIKNLGVLDKELNFQQVNWAIAMTTIGDRLAVVKNSSAHSRISIYPVPQKLPAIEIDVHSPQNAISFSPDGSLLVTAGKEIRIWDAQTGKPIISFGENLIWEGPLGDEYPIRSLSVSVDNSLVAVSGNSPLIRVFDLRSDKILYERNEVAFSDRRGLKTIAVKFTPRNDHLVWLSGGQLKFITHDQLYFRQPFERPTVYGSKIPMAGILDSSCEHFSLSPTMRTLGLSAFDDEVSAQIQDNRINREAFAPILTPKNKLMLFEFYRNEPKEVRPRVFNNAADFENALSAFALDDPELVFREMENLEAQGPRSLEYIQQIFSELEQNSLREIPKLLDGLAAPYGHRLSESSKILQRVNVGIHIPEVKEELERGTRGFQAWHILGGIVTNHREPSDWELQMFRIISFLSTYAFKFPESRDKIVKTLETLDRCRISLPVLDMARAQILAIRSFSLERIVPMPLPKAPGREPDPPERKP
jgi:hypothetical protein